MIRSGLGIQWIQKIGGTPISTSHVLRPSMIGQIHPYYALVSLMALGSSVKQILAIAIVSEQETSVSFAITIALFNTIFNSTNTLLSLWAVTSMLPAAESTYDGIFSSSSVAFAAGAYLLGILVEAISEFQRTAFKRNPENRGKPYGGGLFSLATNINYGGYTIWRAAYALASGGWTWAALTFSFFLYDFATRGVPVLDEYLVQRVSYLKLYPVNSIFV